jgi:hypothetical protein
MKKIIILLLVSLTLSFPKGAFSQNVGIRTTTPVARLHVTDSFVSHFYINNYWDTGSF